MIVAWISVHDTVDGPKLRDLYKKLKCSKFEATGILVYLWHWGLHNADKDGLILSADKEDIEIYFAGMKNGCRIPSEDIVQALLETGWIDEEEEKLYLHDWAFWQKEWYKYQNRLKKDAERKRRAAHMSEPEEKEEAEAKEEIPVEIPKEVHVETPQKKKRTPKEYSNDFLKFWDIYPRNDKKSEAFECFSARLKNGFSSEDMIKAAEAYAEKCKKLHTETQYIMQAKTFLSTHLNFTDYIPKEPVKPQYKAQEGNPFEMFSEG